MHALEAAFKVFLQVFKGLCRRSTTGDEDIVMIGMRTIVRQGGHGVLQAPANAVSDHGFVREQHALQPQLADAIVEGGGVRQRYGGFR